MNGHSRVKVEIDVLLSDFDIFCMNGHSRVKVEIDVLLSDFYFSSGKTSGKKCLK